MITGSGPTGGAPRAIAGCDMVGCDRTEVVPCAYIRSKRRTAPREPDQHQIHSKLKNQGWSYVKGKLRCPPCEAKRKVTTMKVVGKTEAPREPTKRQRIGIFTMLAECYDIDAGRYQRGDTDETIADVLGVMPGWVAKIRDADFGPDGGNANMEALSAAFEQSRSAFRDLLTELEAAGDEVKRIETQMKAQKDRLDSATASLNAIRKAVGPRVMKLAGG